MNTKRRGDQELSMASKPKIRKTILIQQQWKYRLSDSLYLGSIPGYGICDRAGGFPPGTPVSSHKNTDNENDYSLFHNRCLINYIFLLEVYCFYVWSTLSWSCYFCMDFCCTYVCGFGFNTTMVELIESGLNHKLVFITETLLYMYVWSCCDLFWYTLDSEIFINWTNQ